MQDYLTLLNARDPNAVVVIFGDHGLIRSRGWSSDKGVKKLFPNAIKTLDERSIGLFVRPANFCTDKIRPDYRLQNLMGDLLQCMDAYTPKPASSG